MGIIMDILPVFYLKEGGFNMDAHNTLYDIAIVGCGPAGLSAAVNAVIRNKKVIVLGGEFCSPKMHRTPRINNYLGFYNISGEDLRTAFLRHVEEMGIAITKRKVDSIYSMDGQFNLIAGKDVYYAKAVVVATGVAVFRHLPGEEKFLGRGVGYCATCDGPLYRDKDVAVISYISEGEQEANYLSELARSVYYIPMYDEIKNINPDVKVVRGKVKKIAGEEYATHLHLENAVFKVDGVFIIREMIPAVQLIPGIETFDNHIKTDKRMATNIPGLFAAGDCTGKPYQLAKAVGEGQLAALKAVEYLDSQK